MDLNKTAEYINILSEFCGKRDIEELTLEALRLNYGISKADIIILFGGSIPEGCDVVGKAMLQGISDKLMLVGGEGHTTQSLRQKIHAAYPEIKTAGKMEADIMFEYLKLKYGIKDCLMERNSTNCGNNVTYALEMMMSNGMKPGHIIILQDATMQRRMDAGFRKYLGNTNHRIINYATYKATVIVEDGKLEFQQKDIWGMWDMERYISLLMGEIPRLSDDSQGYGPRGKDFIAHEVIPPKVMEAFLNLKDEYETSIRIANPIFASQ
jgi:uncharacterized SAM-binding protein YcdF (DUF218 family)